MLLTTWNLLISNWVVVKRLAIGPLGQLLLSNDGMTRKWKQYIPSLSWFCQTGRLRLHSEGRLVGQCCGRLFLSEVCRGGACISTSPTGNITSITIACWQTASLASTYRRSLLQSMRSLPFTSSAWITYFHTVCSNAKPRCRIRPRVWIIGDTMRSMPDCVLVDMVSLLTSECYRPVARR